MEDVKINSLQGLASFVVLCCRYVETTQVINTMIERLIRGSLGKVVFGGRLHADSADGVQLPYTIKSLLANFVRATLDADADSRQTADAKSWMAELSIHVGSSSVNQKSPKRLQEHNLSLLQELFGGPSAQEDMSRHCKDLLARDLHPDPDDDCRILEEHGRRVHDTLSLRTAYLALAAAANGADLVVECITGDGKTIVPKKRENAISAFAVRLWLCQHIISLLYEFAC